MPITIQFFIDSVMYYHSEQKLQTIFSVVVRGGSILTADEQLVCKVGLISEYLDSGDFCHYFGALDQADLDTNVELDIVHVIFGLDTVQDSRIVPAEDRTVFHSSFSIVSHYIVVLSRFLMAFEQDFVFKPCAELCHVCDSPMADLLVWTLRRHFNATNCTKEDSNEATVPRKPNFKVVTSSFWIDKSTHYSA